MQRGEFVYMYVCIIRADFARNAISRARARFSLFWNIALEKYSHAPAAHSLLQILSPFSKLLITMVNIRIYIRIGTVGEDDSGPVAAVLGAYTRKALLYYTNLKAIT